MQGPFRTDDAFQNTQAEERISVRLRATRERPFQNVHNKILNNFLFPRPKRDNVFAPPTQRRAFLEHHTYRVCDFSCPLSSARNERHPFGNRTFQLYLINHS
jgi:hypothetical protein